MARNPALWIRVPNGGTPDSPAVYTAIRDSLREISEAVRLLQGGPATVSAAAAQSASAAPYSNTGPTLVTTAPATGYAGFRLPHGTAPSSPVNGDMWTTTSGLFAYINGTTVGPFSAASGVYLPLAGGTMTGLLTTVASGTSSSGFNLPHGAAPTAPVNGDLWTMTTGIYVRINGATVGPLAATPTGQALTRTNDTNVTLTLGGTPTTALLAATALTLGWSGQLSIARGGTGQSTATAAFDALSPLTTLGDIIYRNGTNNVRLAGNTTTTRLFLAQTGTGTVSAAPTWTNVAAADVVSGAALTEVDDTNVTLTLGGTPTSALLKAVSLTLGWTGTLAQSRGGFGADISSVLQNRVYASPDGMAGSPTFRALVANDIPSLSSIYLPLAGGTMSGNINMNSNDLTNVDGISATQVFIGAAVSGGTPFYAKNTDTTFTDTFRDLGGFDYTVSPSAAAPTTQYTSMYAATTINSVNTISNRVRAVWGEIFAQTAIANVSAVYGDITLTGTANTTNAIAVHAGAPVASSTGRITGYAAGVYIDAQTGGAVTGTAYGIYQASTSDKNILAGNTRIGSTTTATNALDVTGAATVSGNFTVDTTTLHVDSTNNRVGVGTSSPSYGFDINFGAVVGVLTAGITNTDTGASSDARLTLFNSTTNGGLIQRSTGHATEASDLLLYSAANDIQFYTNGSNRMTLTSAGNFTVDGGTLFVDAANNRVGIGTTSAFAKLEFGNTNASFNTTTPGTTRYGIHFQSDTAGSNDFATGISWAGNGIASGAGAQAGIYVQSSSSYGAKMYFATTNSYATGAQTAMTIDHNRFVGVGTTTPGVRLDVSETLAVATSSTFSAAAIRMNPVYTATGTITVKHRYLHFTQPTISGGTTTFTDAHTMYFDAAAGTHRAVDAGTTKTTPGTVNAWVKIDINGTTYYIPAYTSKTA